MNAQYFDSITLTTPLDEIYRRLGYRRTVTKLSVEQKKKVERYIADALSLISLKGVAKRVAVASVSSSQVQLSSGLVFRSQRLAEFLQECDEILLMGATAGREIVEAIQANSAGDNIACAVVLDAVASEIVDKALDWIMAYFNRDLRRASRCLTRRRYSAGYGDFLLENQQIICKTLGMKKMGVVVNERHILVPEKSVTAIAGIGPISK
ncbi:MAG: methionine synthase [Candidatus Omnitrophota bacterium]